jgi:serine/threonine protein kinase
VYLGRYKILKPLSQGNASEVFLAEAASIEGFRKLVLVKCLLAELEGDREARRMFIDEARLCAKLPSANLPFVFDFGHADGRMFMVMEYIEGETLASVLRSLAARGQALSTAAVLAVASGLLRALHAIHTLKNDNGEQLGVVHRDVSPDNVMVTRHGQVKLIDFGIAKHSERLSVTRRGIVRGRFRYLAPEPANGQPATAKSDQFSAALVLFEGLTGTPAYVGDEAECLAQARVVRLSRPVATATSLSASLGRALSPLPEDRFEDCLAFCRALEGEGLEQRIIADPEGLAGFLAES